MIMLAINICTAVGPNVESLAGEPESPNALAVPINAINAIVSSPIDAPKGMNNDAIIGIVANDDPIPKVTIKPITYIMIMLNNLLSPVILVKV